MALGKNKRSSKGGRKKQKHDAFVRKEWYKVRVPRTFVNRTMGWTCVNKSSGNKNASDSLRGRMYEFYLGDLARKGNKQADYENQDKHDGTEGGFRKVKVICEEISTRDCLTNFAGMSMTTEKLRDCIKKWSTLIEAYADVRTTDGYLLRLFAMARTDEAERQIRRTSYAKSSQVREIRRRMVDTIVDEIKSFPLEDVVKKLKANNIGEAIRKNCSNTFPIAEVRIRKVKVLKRPATDYLKIMAMHDAAKEDNDDLPRQEIENVDGMEVGEEDGVMP